MEKDIDFIVESLQNFTGKHFSLVESSYFRSELMEPREEIEPLGILIAVYDIDKNIVMCFGRKEQAPPGRLPKFVTKRGITDFKAPRGYSYNWINYRSDLITPHIDVLVNGVDVYVHHITLQTGTNIVERRNIRRIRYRCDDIEMPNHYPKLPREEFMKRFF